MEKANIREPEEAGEILEKLKERLKDPEYQNLRRTFAEWCSRILFKRSGFLKKLPEFQDLQEVNAMLEERAAQWKDEYIAQGRAEGRAEGKAEGRAEGRSEGEIVGRIIGRAEAVLDLLADLPDKVPEELKDAILAEKDEETLRRYLRQARSAGSVEEFVRNISGTEQS